MIEYFVDFYEVNIDKSILEPKACHKGENQFQECKLRLITNSKRSDYIDIEILYKPPLNLFEIFKDKHEKGESFLDCIVNANDKEVSFEKHELDFSKSRIINFDPIHRIELSFRRVAFSIDKVTIYSSSSFKNHGEFKLTQNSIKHIYDYYEYGGLGNCSSEDKFIEQDKNREVEFGEVNLQLSLDHRYGEKTDYYFTIEITPILIITDNSGKLTGNQLYDYGSIICYILSFYWEKEIKFYQSNNRLIGKGDFNSKQEFIYVNDIKCDNYEFLLKDQYSTVYDLIEQIDYNQFSSVKISFKEIVERLIKATHVDEVSRFMLYYNIIEKIKKHCLRNEYKGTKLKVKEKFDFIKPAEANDFIRKKLNEIASIVKEKDREGFKLVINDKISPIKYTPLKNQFNSVAEHLGLSTSEYDIDFVKLVQTRSKVYHGGSANVDFKDININLKKLIYDMILKLIIKE